MLIDISSYPDEIDDFNSLISDLISESVSGVGKKT